MITEERLSQTLSESEITEAINYILMKSINYSSSIDGRIPSIFNVPF